MFVIKLLKDFEVLLYIAELDIYSIYHKNLTLYHKHYEIMQKTNVKNKQLKT